MNSEARTIGRRAAIAGLVALAVGALSGWGAIAAFSNSDPGPRPVLGQMPGDVNGDGVVSDRGPERIPALISAVADNGVEGYVRLTDLEGRVPRSPEEALRQAAELRVIPVFASDGRTIVGHLTESQGGVIERNAEELESQRR